MIDPEFFSDSNLQSFTWRALAFMGVLKMLFPAIRGVWKTAYRAYYRAKRDARRAKREFENDALIPKSG